MTHSTRILKAILWFFGILVVFWFGYAWIADYGDGVASGTYEASYGEQRATLLLRPDHTFVEKLSGASSGEAHGTWGRFGEGGVVFSGGMLVLPGQRIMPNGEAYATLYKTWGVWPPFIALDSTASCPLFRKRIF